MKTSKILLPVISILLAALFLSVMPTEAEAAIYRDTVRLHIVAESDTREHQDIKLLIRDKVLTSYGSLLEARENAAEAEEVLFGRLGEIEANCAEWIREAGSNATVSVTLGKEWYNTREYADFTLPAGEYTSLKIVIGSGEGQNWWCVMYPPLCLDIAVKESGKGYTDTERGLISRSGYNVKFKLLEVASSIFRR